MYLISFSEEFDCRVLLLTNGSSTGGKSFCVGEVDIGLRAASLALICEARSKGGVPTSPGGGARRNSYQGYQYKHSKWYKLELLITCSTQMCTNILLWVVSGVATC